LASAIKDLSRHLVQVRLADRFGDNGIISILIADKRDEVWEIDTWLMSCRVLGRGVEEACLAHLVAAARLEGARKCWTQQKRRLRQCLSSWEATTGASPKTITGLVTASATRSYFFIEGAAIACRRSPAGVIARPRVNQRKSLL
jgi:hypothetical protein